jgi:hypothetical protein
MKTEGGFQKKVAQRSSFGVAAAGNVALAREAAVSKNGLCATPEAQRMKCFKMQT